MIRLVSLLTLSLVSFPTLNAQDKTPQPTSADLSRDETPATAITRMFEYQEYDVRSAAEAMPEEKWDFRPSSGMFKSEKPEFGPAEVRTFREQVKHVAWSLPAQTKLQWRPRLKVCSFDPRSRTLIYKNRGSARNTHAGEPLSRCERER